MSYLKDYKAKNFDQEIVPVIKMSEIEGKTFTVRDFKLVYDMESDFGTADTAILTVIVEGEKFTLFIRQEWIFKIFEQAKADGADLSKDKMRLVKKTKGDKTFWDLQDA